MIYVVTYENRSAIKKVIFENGVLLDIMPDVQEILHKHRQDSGRSSEAGGILVGYENANTGSFTISNATEPQVTDVRTRISLFLGGQHRLILQNYDPPYGYIGTWHTHPSGIPIPSSTDLKDWKKCIKHNRESTTALVFIIAGTMGFRVWLYESSSYSLYEGTVL